MKKITCIALFFLFSPMFLIYVNAEEVVEKDITLSLSFGSRNGIYTGGFENELPNGNGKFESKTLDGIFWYHEGSFVDGHFQGEGAEVWGSGQKDIGNYQNDLLNGQGKRYMNDQLLYEGEWKDGKYNGKGTEYGSSSEKWVGTYEDGFLAEGSYFVNGTLRAQGTWKNGSIWNGRTYDEEGNPYSSFENGNVKQQPGILILFLVITFGFPFIIGGFAVFLFKRHKKNQIKAQIDFMNAQQEVEDRKTINWTCPSCGGANHNREFCQFCGKGKQI